MGLSHTAEKMPGCCQYKRSFRWDYISQPKKMPGCGLNKGAIDESLSDEKDACVWPK